MANARLKAVTSQELDQAVRDVLCDALGRLQVASGVLRVPSAGLPRPANTTAYADGDSVNANPGTGFVFADVVSGNGGGGFIVKAKMNVSDDPALATPFRLWLYTLTSTTVTRADNAALDPVLSAGLVGYIDFEAGDVLANSFDVVYVRDDLRLPFVCATGAKTLYGALQIKGAYTPVSGQEYNIELTISQS